MTLSVQAVSSGLNLPDFILMHLVSYVGRQENTYSGSKTENNIMVGLDKLKGSPGYDSADWCSGSPNYFCAIDITFPLNLINQYPGRKEQGNTSE